MKLVYSDRRHLGCAAGRDRCARYDGCFRHEQRRVFQVGLLTTIGLVSKNAILIVEFAKELHEKGESIVHAAAHAVRMRIRPIMILLCLRSRRASLAEAARAPDPVHRTPSVSVC